MYPSSKKTELPPELKEIKGHHLKNLEHSSVSHWEYLNPMRNLKLLEKYQHPPPPPSKKENLNLQENEKNITPRKSFNHPQIASTILKMPQTPT